MTRHRNQAKQSQKWTPALDKTEKEKMTLESEGKKPDAGPMPENPPHDPINHGS
jgi:hypothetical protein